MRSWTPLGWHVGEGPRRSLAGRVNPCLMTRHTWHGWEGLTGDVGHGSDISSIGVMAGHRRLFRRAGSPISGASRIRGRGNGVPSTPGAHQIDTDRRVNGGDPGRWRLLGGRHSIGVPTKALPSTNTTGRHFGQSINALMLRRDATGAGSKRHIRRDKHLLLRTGKVSGKSVIGPIQGVNRRVGGTVAEFTNDHIRLHRASVTTVRSASLHRPVTCTGMAMDRSKKAVVARMRTILPVGYCPVAEGCSL